MNSKYLLLIVSILFSISIVAQTVSYTMEHDGLTREYNLYIPPSYDGSEVVPLLLNLHGYTSNMTEQEFYGDFRPIADTANFLIVHPNGTFDGSGERWWNAYEVMTGPDDIGFLSALVDTIAENYAVNLDRVYSTGMSNGGFMSFELACEKSDIFAAVASVTGSMPINKPSNCNPNRPIPSMQIHGTADEVVPYNGSAQFESVENVVDYWVTQTNSNSTPVEVNIPDTDPNDGSTAKQYIYENGDQGTSVEHFKVENGGHTWPGSSINLPGSGSTNQDFDASIEIWRFFSQYDKQGFLNVENIEKDNIKIYPNPTSSKVSFENLEHVSDLKIFDNKGSLIQAFSDVGNELTISHQLQKGIYQVVFYSQNELTTKKLVVQ